MSGGRERPIIMSGESVRAILDGRKVQTRRVVSDGTSQGNYPASRFDLSQAHVDPGPSPAGNPGPYLKAPVEVEDNDGVWDRLYPRWFPGDRLWVRETWACSRDTAGEYERENVIYRADPMFDGCDPGHIAWNWAPSLFMPRWASRLTLELTEVRVERVAEISEADIIAEGIPEWRSARGVLKPDWQPTDAFARHWDALNAKRGYPWASNPWCWCLTFRAVP